MAFVVCKRPCKIFKGKWRCSLTSPNWVTLHGTKIWFEFELLKKFRTKQDRLMVGIKKKPSWESQVLQNQKVLVKQKAKHMLKSNRSLCAVSEAN